MNFVGIINVDFPEREMDDIERIRAIAAKAWQGAANAHRMYPQNKHTFSNYWDAAAGQFEEFL